MLSLTRHPAATPGPAAPLVIAHGLFGSGRNWGVLARRLSDTRDVVTVDMRNHGASDWLPAHGYPEMAADLAEVIASLGGRADLLGHSMGGKAAMWLALTQPERVDRLVVADIAPVAYAHDHSGHCKAMRSLDLQGVTRRSEADARLAKHLPDAGLRTFLLQSLDLAAQPPRWRLNLEVLEAEMPRIVGWPAISARFPRPALFLSGALSDYVAPAQHDRILAHFPAAQFACIADAGHWLHAERPRDFEQAVRAFLG